MKQYKRIQIDFDGGLWHLALGRVSRRLLTRLSKSQYTTWELDYDLKLFMEEEYW